MNRIIKNGKIIRYIISEKIEVHKNIFDPDKWHLTIRELDIFTMPLCKITSTESEIRVAIAKELDNRSNKLNSIHSLLISDI